MVKITKGVIMIMKTSLPVIVFLILMADISAMGTYTKIGEEHWGTYIRYKALNSLSGDCVYIDYSIIEELHSGRYVGWREVQNLDDSVTIVAMTPEETEYIFKQFKKSHTNPQRHRE